MEFYRVDIVLISALFNWLYIKVSIVKRQILQKCSLYKNLIVLLPKREAIILKRIKAFVYTCGKFGKNLRETLDKDNKFLYSGGIYPTKIQEKDLPEFYCKIHSRSIWYMQGYIKTADVKYIEYSYVDENHMFKDDFIYISYKE